MRARRLPGLRENGDGNDQSPSYPGLPTRSARDHGRLSIGPRASGLELVGERTLEEYSVEGAGYAEVRDALFPEDDSHLGLITCEPVKPSPAPA